MEALNQVLFPLLLCSLTLERFADKPTVRLDRKNWEVPPPSAFPFIPEYPSDKAFEIASPSPSPVEIDTPSPLLIAVPVPRVAPKAEASPRPGVRAVARA